jgi:tRNA(fMet)-specific endonuclease VapC
MKPRNMPRYMARYMLDTNICIYIAKHQPPQMKARFEQLKPGQLVMSAITYGELQYGASKSSQRSRALQQLQQLVQDIPVESLDSAAAQAYGEVRATLEKQGRPIGNNDLWIAAHAMALDVTLATNNEREFRRIPGLSVENWTK